MVKRFFLRVENWLLIMPAILFFIEKIYFSGSSFDLHLHDTYFIIAGFHIAFVIMVFCWLLFLCHFSLRVKKTGNKRIRYAHVIVTLSLLLFFFTAIRQNSKTQERYYDFSNRESYTHNGPLNYILAIGAMAFLIIQLLFLLYTGVQLIIKKQ